MKILFNLLGIFLMSVSIVSCGGKENNKSTEPSSREGNKESTESSINQDQKLEEEKEYPYNVKWVSDISPSDIEIIISEEKKCKEIEGMANEVESYDQWKKEMYGKCD